MTNVLVEKQRGVLSLLSGGGVISEGVESKRPESIIGQGENEPN